MRRILPLLLTGCMGSAIGGGCTGDGVLTATPLETPSSGPDQQVGNPQGTGARGQTAPSEIPADSSGFALSIESPEAGAVVLRSPIRVTGTASGVEMVVVAGLEIPVMDGHFRATLPLADGAHIVGAQAAGRTVEVAFTVDAGGPEIDILEPARGTFHDPDSDGPSVVVRGAVTDMGSGVTTLTVDGTPVRFDDKGAFTTTVTPRSGLSTIVLVAVDGSGHTSSATRSLISGRFDPAASPVEGGLDVTLGRDGLETIIDQARDALATTPLEDLVPLGGDGGDFEVTSFRYQGTDVDLAPDFGGFNLSVRIHGLQIGIRIEKTIVFVPVKFSGSVSARTAELRAFLSVSATADGSVEMSLGDASVELQGFDYDIDGLPGFLEGLLSGFVRGFAEGALEDALNGVVLPSLFDPSDLVQTMDLLGTQLTLAMKLSLLTVSPDGLRFQASVSASAPLAAGGGRANPGAVTDVARSAQGQGGPEGPLSVAISADAVNRVLHAVWVAGALNLEVDLGAAGGDGGAMPIQFDVAGMGAALGLPLDQAAPGDAPVTLSMRPMLPPVLVPAPAGDPDKAATISLGDMLFSIEARPTGQPAIDLLTVALAIDADLAAGDPDDGQGLAGLSVIADLESSAVPAQAEVVEGGVARLLTLAAPLLTRALGGEAAPAEPGKLTLVDALFGSNGGSLVIAGALGLSDAAGPPPR